MSGRALRGKMTLYTQELDAGYSAPDLNDRSAAPENFGGAISAAGHAQPVSVNGKNGYEGPSSEGIQTDAWEVNAAVSAQRESGT